MMFQATARNKRGAILDTAYADTPELAARQIFLRRPSCETVQVCNAYLEGDRPRGNGSNIHWISRSDVLDRAVAALKEGAL